MQYDISMKSILESLGNILTPSLTGSKPVELLNVVFNSVMSRIPDLVWRLADGRIFHLEIQSYNDPSMPIRMLIYWFLLRERYPRDSLVQHVLYIGDRPCSMATSIVEANVSYRYDLTDIRDIEEDVFLSSESPADRLLAVLSKVGNERITIRRILASWAGNPIREREDLIQKLVILSGLRKLNEIVLEEVAKMPITIDPMENTTIRRWIEQGMEKGIEKGIEKGMEKGGANILGKLLSKRFGPLPPEAEGKLRSAHSDQLERWALRLMDANTLDEVLAG